MERTTDLVKRIWAGSALWGGLVTLGAIALGNGILVPTLGDTVLTWALSVLIASVPVLTVCYSRQRIWHAIARRVLGCSDK